MKLKTRRKIIKIFLLFLLILLISAGLIVYNVLGPLRIFFWNTPYLFGFLGPKTYLVLLQNNNELRPTGGFITAAAEVNFLFGFPSLTVFDSYQVPNPNPKIPAPEPFEFLIGQNDPFFAGWTFRDANFSPDFAQSSKDVMTLYKSAYPDRNIDGVIAIDFDVIEGLLKLYGPITIDDIRFDENNFFINSQRISKDIDTHNVDELKSRKNILQPFFQTLKSSIISSPGQYGKLSSDIYKLLREKHIMAYSSSESFQAKIENNNFGNRVINEDLSSDFLHVNIANIGGRKADRYVTKDIKYLADFSNPDSMISRLEIRLEHLGSYNIQSDIYQAYIRIYAPLNSELTGSTGDTLKSTEAGNDLNLTVLADYIRLKPGETLTLSYTYKIPPRVIPEDYKLKIIKQPGIQNQNWQLAVKHMNDSSMENVPNIDRDYIKFDIRENLALWRGILDQDSYFRLFKDTDKKGPIILWQKFIDLNTVNVRFQELVDTSTALNIANYQISDLNKNNPTSDTVTVSKVKFEGRDLWLTISGATGQDEEFYELTIKDVQDFNGNIISPNPLTRTLVQRLKKK